MSFIFIWWQAHQTPGSAHPRGTAVTWGCRISLSCAIHQESITTRRLVGPSKANYQSQKYVHKTYSCCLHILFAEGRGAIRLGQAFRFAQPKATQNNWIRTNSVLSFKSNLWAGLDLIPMTLDQWIFQEINILPGHLKFMEVIYRCHPSSSQPKKNKTNHTAEILGFMILYSWYLNHL